MDAHIVHTVIKNRDSMLTAFLIGREHLDPLCTGIHGTKASNRTEFSVDLIPRPAGAGCSDFAITLPELFASMCSNRENEGHRRRYYHLLNGDKNSPAGNEWLHPTDCQLFSAEKSMSY